MFRLPAIVSILLAGCSPPEEERPLVGDHRRPTPVDLYFSIDECVEAGRLNHAKCTSGLRQALAKHDRFSPRWNGPHLCEEKHGKGACTSAPPTKQGQPYWWPRPVAFLTRFPDGSEPAPILFAPVYRDTRWGLYTGQGGGYLQADYSGHGPLPRKERHQVVGRIVELPVI
jgi:uncharacterized protein YgiB involved in biofilm formation